MQKKLKDARNRLSKLIKRKTESENKNISFIVNDNTVYTSPTDFKSVANQKTFFAIIRNETKNKRYRITT